MRHKTIVMAGSILMVLGVGTASAQIEVDPEEEELPTPKPLMHERRDRGLESDPGFNPDPPPQGTATGTPSTAGVLGARRSWMGVIQLDETPRPDAAPGAPDTRSPSKGNLAGRPGDLGGVSAAAGQVVRPDQGWTGAKKGSDPDDKGKGLGVDDSQAEKKKKPAGKTTPRPQGADSGSSAEGRVPELRNWAGVEAMDETPRPDGGPGRRPGELPSRPDPTVRPH